MKEFLVSHTLNGQLPSLKNRRRLIPGKGGRKPMIIKSAEAMSYEAMFLASIPQEKRIGYGGPVSLKVRVWYQSRRSDLSTELLMDLLQKAGIILNDRQVVHIESFKGLDPERPRVHFTVSPAQECPCLARKGVQNRRKTLKHTTEGGESR